MIFGWGVQECGARERLFKLHEHMFFPCVSTSPLSVPLWKASSSPMLVWQMVTLGHKWSRVWKSGFNHISTPFRWFECPNRCETFGSSGVLPCLDSVKHLGFSLEEILTSSDVILIKYHNNVWIQIMSLQIPLQRSRWRGDLGSRGQMIPYVDSGVVAVGPFLHFFRSSIV